MNLESGKIYSAEVYEEDIIDGDKEYETQALFLHQNGETSCRIYDICRNNNEEERCKGLVKLIFPRAIGSEKKADIENPLQMVEALICLNYKDSILTPEKGNLSIHLVDAFSFGSDWIKKSDYQKELLTKFRGAQE
ncbi:MAG: hypothetical protein ACOC1P_02195 [Minisyncoccales bacterium]